MLWQKPRAAALRQSDVNQRHNRAAQVENAQEIGRSQGQLGEQRKVQDFLDVQHRQAESFAPAAKDAELGLRWALFERAESFQQIGNVGVRGQWSQMEIFDHLCCRPQAKLLCETSYGAQQLVAREWLGDIAIGALLLTPIFVAYRILGGDHDYRDGAILRVAFEFPANLKAIALRHDHVQQNQARALGGNGFLDAPRIVDPDGLVAFGLQQPLHELHLGRRIVDDQDFFLHGRALRIVLQGSEVHVRGQLDSVELLDVDLI